MDGSRRGFTSFASQQGRQGFATSPQVSPELEHLSQADAAADRKPVGQSKIMLEYHEDSTRIVAALFMCLSTGGSA